MTLCSIHAASCLERSCFPALPLRIGQKAVVARFFVSNRNLRFVFACDSIGWRDALSARRKGRFAQEKPDELKEFPDELTANGYMALRNRRKVWHNGKKSGR